MLYCRWPPLPVIGALSIETMLQYAETQSDCLRAFVQSVSVRVIRNRETLFRTATARACVRQVVYVWTIVGMRVCVG